MFQLNTRMSAPRQTEKRKDYPITPVPFNDVQFTDLFWAARIDKNRTVSIPAVFQRCEETGRIDNFAKASSLMKGSYGGIYPFDDSDVYKVIEAASYSLATHPDKELETRADQVIAKITAAQEKDGYLCTWRALKPEGEDTWSGRTRWSNLARSHELYNAGHLIEAAIADYLATGNSTFLDSAIKFADLIDRVFGPDRKHDVPGHPNIEMALAELYRLTGYDKYLKLAKFFIDERGRHHHRKSYREYALDHKPVIEQDEAVGHAVRAVYLYSAMVDVGALTGDKEYLEAIDRIWENVVSKKLYITGGIGANGTSDLGIASGETFGANYELPNRTGYNETCAAIGNVFWNHRMFLLHGDAKYIDILERTLYNGLISGVSLKGDTYFYPNPLESNGKFPFNHGASTRKPWFDCACCPGNLTRLIASLGSYVYAHRNNIIYVNLFAGSDGKINMGPGRAVRIRQESRYPWDGTIKIIVEPTKIEEFAINVRIPCWARNHPVPSDLYQYLGRSEEEAVLKVNGEFIPLRLTRGYVSVHRTWTHGDVIELRLPMPIRRVVANKKVLEDRGKVALERGPIVYCAESVDNQGQVLNLLLPDDVPLRAEYREDMLDGVVVISGKALALSNDGKSSNKVERDFVAIPYYAWSNRGEGEMIVWVTRSDRE
jgi:DUF1680 family protein